MRKQLIVSMLATSLLGVPALFSGGCDRTVSDEKTVKTDPNSGKTVEKEKKVERTSDGGTKTTEEHRETRNP